MIEQEILYERKLTGSYMKIAAVDCSKFDEQMLLARKVRGALPVELCYLNEEAWYWYNISGKQSLDTYCRIHDVGISFIEKIIISICDEISILEWSLFDLNCLLLTPELIFINNLNQEVIFTVYPGGKEDLSEQFRELMEYLLTKVDHNDAEAVRAAYGIYEKTLDEAYGIMDIRDYIILNRQENSRNHEFTGEDKENKNNKSNKGTTIFSQRFHDGDVSIENLQNRKMYKEKQTVAKINTGKPDKEKTLGVSHKVFPEIMKILNNWKESFAGGNGQSSSGTEISQITRNKKKTEATYMPPIQVSLQVAEDIGQTTCLSSYAAYTRGELIYMGNDNLENIPLPKQNTTIGKSSSADVLIDRNTISQFHAKVSFQDHAYYLEDLNSTNGTFVNEEVLSYKKMHKLQVNDIVRFADVSYRFI